MLNITRTQDIVIIVTELYHKKMKRPPSEGKSLSVVKHASY